MFICSASTLCFDLLFAPRVGAILRRATSTRGTPKIIVAERAIGAPRNLRNSIKPRLPGEAAASTVIMNLSSAKSFGVGAS
jgi:hypothetical protein